MDNTRRGNTHVHVSPLHDSFATAPDEGGPTTFDKTDNTLQLALQAKAQLTGPHLSNA